MASKHHMDEATRQAIISAGKEIIARNNELRAQRPFRDMARKVINIAAYRPNPLLQRSGK